jgi:hypothetical protein
LRRSILFWFAFGWATVLAGGAAQAARVKIPLSHEAVVRGGTIYLSDLLPASTPPEMRAAAAEISVGQSPLPGSLRILSADALIRLLGTEHLLDEVEIPPRILVRRSGRPIGREEVTAAIAATLQRNEAFHTLEIRPDAVRFSSAVMVSTESADLRVTRLEFDRTLHVMQFWLVSGADPAIQPFMVMARPSNVTDDVSILLGLPQAQHDGNADAVHVSDAAQSTHIAVEANISGARFPQRAEPAASEVEPGKPARLHLVSASGTEMFLTATALERGAIGQQIRVRIQNTGRILGARVAGRGQLEAQY